MLYKLNYQRIINYSVDTNYRLCVVTNAVSSPRLWTFAYDNGIWICEQDYETELLFEEHIAAIAYIE